MTYFSLLVTGENPEEQLSPFSMDNLEHFRVEDLLFQATSVKGENSGIYENRELAVAALGELDENDSYLFNPHGRWDWYFTAAHHSKLFRLKPGRSGSLSSHSESDIHGLPNENEENLDWKPLSSAGLADSALLCDIDFEGFHQQVGIEANLTYSRFENILGDLPWPESLAVLRTKTGDLDEGWKLYRQQPAIRAMTRARLYSGSNPLELEFSGSRSDYVTRKLNEVYATYAVLHEGRWYWRDGAVWWDSRVQKPSLATWNEQFQKLLTGLPSETLLSLVTCHR